MKDFIYNYIDHLTLGITLLLTYSISYSVWKKTGKTTRLGMLPLLFLGPVMLMTCMLMHLLEVFYHCWETDFSGKFSLRFHLYSLILMALVIGEAGRRFYQGTRAFVFASLPKRSVMVRPAGLVALILFPLLWLTPLSFMMFFVCAISLFASFLVHKPCRMADQEQLMVPLKEIAGL